MHMINLKSEFPIFLNYKQKYKTDLTYLNSAETSLKPKIVLDSINDFYSKIYSNFEHFADTKDIISSGYELDLKVQQLIFDAKSFISSFFNAKKHELIFTQNATSAINALIYSFFHKIQKKGILTTIVEHHANLVPFLNFANQHKNPFFVLSIGQDFSFDKDELYKILKNNNIFLFTFTGLSNVLGDEVDIQKIANFVKNVSQKTYILVDATQLITYRKIDFDKLNIDFLVFSGHKIYGPTGIGGLLVKKHILDKDFRPWIYGGRQIIDIKDLNTPVYDKNMMYMPGTQNLSGIIGLYKALLWYQKKFDKTHFFELRDYFCTKLKKYKNVHIVGKPCENKANLISFYINGINAIDLSTVLKQFHIVIRSGFHCAKPLHDFLKIPQTARVSFGMYNTKQDIDRFFEGLDKALKIFM